MTESHEASTDITLIRRDLARLRDDVKEVDAKVERTRITELAALAVNLARETGDDLAVIMVEAGMSHEDVCTATRLKPSTLRVRLHRARSRRARARSKSEKA